MKKLFLDFVFWKSPGKTHFHSVDCSISVHSVLRTPCTEKEQSTPWKWFYLTFSRKLHKKLLFHPTLWLFPLPWRLFQAPSGWVLKRFVGQEKIAFFSQVILDKQNCILPPFPPAKSVYSGSLMASRISRFARYSNWSHLWSKNTAFLGKSGKIAIEENRLVFTNV